MRRKVDNEREARAFLKAAKAAGLTAGAWAREHGIDGRSLNAWQISSKMSRASIEPPVSLSVARNRDITSRSSRR